MSEFEVTGLNWIEIALYLKYHLTDEEIKQNQIEEYCPTRLSNRGRPPTFTASGSDTDIDKRLGPWVYKNTTPSENEKKKMFCMAVRIMIEKTMSLHDYVFNGDIIRQKGGGSIGLDLTGVVADIYMDHWDAEYVKILERNNIKTKLYKRYKDDINLVLDTNINGNNKPEREATTLEVIMEKANSIHPSIKVTGDIPSRYDDNRLPILDLKVWIGEAEPNVYKVMTSHYMKDVSTRAVINEKSSHPKSMKKNVLINEALRILRNCSEFLEWEETAGHLSYFMKRLQFSGYDQDFRHQVMKTALKRYQDNKGRCNNNAEEVKRKKRWQRGSEATMFVQATPNEELKEEIQQCAKKNKIHIRVREKVDCNVRRELQRSNPFREKTCGKESCIVCQQENGVDCKTRGCVYEMECKDCGRKYRGQTGNSLRERMDQHFDDWKRKESSSPLHRHSQIFHGGKSFPVSIKLLKRCFGDPTGRKITEAVLIDKLSNDQPMNGKNEWTYVKLNKVWTTN